MYLVRGCMEPLKVFSYLIVFWWREFFDSLYFSSYWCSALTVRSARYPLKLTTSKLIFVCFAAGPHLYIVALVLVHICIELMSILCKSSLVNPSSSSLLIVCCFSRSIRAFPRKKKRGVDLLSGNIAVRKMSGCCCKGRLKNMKNFEVVALSTAALRYFCL